MARILPFFYALNLYLMFCHVGLLKDCGWMTTNIYLGFCFGAMSILLHALLLVVDTRKSFMFYNISLFMWVCGNFLWMTIEFTDTNPSSNIHFGPDVPIGGIPESAIYIMTQTKTVLFLIGWLSQISMYILIFWGKLPIPEQEDEDIVVRNEATLFLFGNKSYTAATVSDVDSMLDMDEDFPEYHDVETFQTRGESSPLITLAFIENAYILFWISKDLFWSFGTGDLTQGLNSAIIYEIFAMCFGFSALCVYLVTAYIYRRKKLRFLDGLTTVFWICANYVWMCGEFFVRYDHLQHDDGSPGDDRNTRIAAATFFAVGFALQMYVSAVLYLRYRARRNQDTLTTGTASISVSGVPNIDMFDVKSLIRYQTLMVSFSPQHTSESEMQEVVKQASMADGEVLV